MMGDPERQTDQLSAHAWPRFNNGSLYPAVAWGGIFKPAVEKLFESAHEKLHTRALNNTLGVVVVAFGANDGEVAHVSFGDSDPRRTGQALIELGQKILETSGMSVEVNATDALPAESRL